MKKGAKLMEDGYLVEISDLDGNYWCAPMTTNSLRRGVAYAAEKVISRLHRVLISLSF
jgi:hypothetical protein